MKTEHLSEELIQQLAISPEVADAGAKQHLQGCAHCLQLVQEYKLLFKEVAAIPAPAFEFDLVQLVMAKIPAAAGAVQPVPELANAPAVPAAQLLNKQPAKQYSWFTIAAVIACLVIVGAPFYYFRNDIQNMVSGLSVIVTYLIVISVLLIAGFQVADEYRKYNNRINSLDLYK